MGFPPLQLRKMHLHLAEPDLGIGISSISFTDMEIQLGKPMRNEYIYRIDIVISIAVTYQSQSKEIIQTYTCKRLLFTVYSCLQPDQKYVS